MPAQFCLCFGIPVFAMFYVTAALYGRSPCQDNARRDGSQARCDLHLTISRNHAAASRCTLLSSAYGAPNAHCAATFVFPGGFRAVPAVQAEYRRHNEAKTVPQLLVGSQCHSGTPQAHAAAVHSSQLEFQSAVVASLVSVPMILLCLGCLPRFASEQSQSPPCIPLCPNSQR